MTRIQPDYLGGLYWVLVMATAACILLMALSLLGGCGQ